MSSKKKQSPNFTPLDEDIGVYKTSNEYEDVNPSLLPTTAIYSNGKKYLLNINHLNDIFGRIEGKMLTLIEGTAEDKEKREATKSLARQLIWSVMKEIRMLPLIKQK